MVLKADAGTNLAGMLGQIGWMLAVVMLATTVSGCGEKPQDPDIKAMTDFAKAKEASERMASEMLNNAMKQSPPSAPPPLPQAPKPLQKKSGADLTTSLEKYVLFPLEDKQRDLVYLYAALGGQFVGGEDQLLRIVSGRYNSEQDAFKRKEIEAVEKPRVQTEIERHKSQRYFAFPLYGWMRGTWRGFELSVYDFDKKGFSLTQKCETPWRADSGIVLKTLNGDDSCLGFGFLNVEDVEVAKRIESLRARSELVLRPIVYAYAEEAADGHIVITPTAVRVRAYETSQLTRGGDIEQQRPVADLMAKK